MATDKSEPQMGLIFKIGILAVATVIAVRAGLMTYFDDITRFEMHRKYGEVVPEALQNLRASERSRLTTGPMPIGVAMQHMAAQCLLDLRWLRAVLADVEVGRIRDTPDPARLAAKT